MIDVKGSTERSMPARLSTGIAGLDEVLGGGLPQGNMLHGSILSGEPRCREQHWLTR